jgi:hypothetical protein
MLPTAAGRHPYRARRGWHIAGLSGYSLFLKKDFNRPHLRDSGNEDAPRTSTVFFS